MSERQSQWKNLLLLIPQKKKLRILIHASSMGEFEQAKPIIEKIKSKFPETEIIASFFSPSGFRNQQKYKKIDYSCYLPIDTKKNAEYFAKQINPDIAIFVRYDLWLNTLTSLKNIGSKNYLVCATKPSGKFLTNYKIGNQYLQECYSQFEYIFTVGSDHSDFISLFYDSKRIKALSDTRADRILDTVNIAKKNKILPDSLVGDVFLFIAGSSWTKDETIISQAVNLINKDKFICRVIYVPHEPTERNIEAIEKLHNKVIRLSAILNELKVFDTDILKNNLKDAHLVVDSIGKLLKLYANADAAFIGCGFDDGVHSVSEPAGYGLSIASGPKINTMPDAIELNKLGGLKIINNSNELKIWLEKIINDENYRKKISKINENYILRNSGSSEKISEIILKSAVK
ncbi:MAG: hypothetical protein KIT33_14290 [Candidatus Kapabacteria bacterium]|nr:hypothetical protein [Ignavibacteriota bacterium]MCW5886137.1 hypothetical protein [Candidatus Kapabacteria bacterium]